MEIEDLRSQTQKRRSPKRRGPRVSVRRIGTVLVTGLVLLVLLGGAGILFFLRQRMVTSEAHEVASYYVLHNDLVYKKIGTDVKLGFFPFGSLGDEASHITYGVSGSSGSGRVEVELAWEDGTWEVTEAVLDGPGGPVWLVTTTEAADDGEYHPDPEAERHLLRGAQLINAGRTQEGIRELSAAIMADDQYAEAWYWRGRAYQEDAQYEAALNDFQRALDLDDNHADAHEGIAYVYGKLGQYEQALPHLDRYVELRPEEGRAWHARGHAHFQLHHTEQARSDATKGCELGYQPACDALQSL